jgi:putative aldouronate transport system substrate-binding protein
VLTKDYKGFWTGDNPVGSSWSWSISAATKNRDACLRYVDYMYSMDGLMTLINGPKGLIWDVNSKGEPFVTEQGWDTIENNKDLPGGGKMGEGIVVVNSFGLSQMTVNPKYGTPLGWGYWPSSKGRKPTTLLKDWQDTTGFKTTTEMLKAKNLFTLTPLALNMVPAMPDEIKNLAAQVGDLVKTNSWLMVFAADEARFNALYKEMVDKANGLGIAKIIDWDTKAWEAAKAAASKYAR